MHQMRFKKAPVRIKVIDTDRQRSGRHILDLGGNAYEGG
jgi:hypothetical protein